MRAGLTHGLALGLVVLCATAPATAAPAPGDRAWVRDTLYVPLRRGPSGQHGIIRTLPSGTALRIEAAPTEDGGNAFVEVVTDNGTRGFLPLQYVSEEPIARDRLAAAEDRIDALREQLAAATGARSDLDGERADLASRLADLEARHAALTATYAELVALSSDAVETDRRARALGRLNAVLEAEVERLATALHAAEDDNDHLLLGAGGLLLGAGLFIGALLRGRRRSGWA